MAKRKTVDPTPDPPMPQAPRVKGADNEPMRMILIVGIGVILFGIIVLIFSKQKSGGDTFTTTENFGTNAPGGSAPGDSDGGSGTKPGSPPGGTTGTTGTTTSGGGFPLPPPVVRGPPIKITPPSVSTGPGSGTYHPLGSPVASPGPWAAQTPAAVSSHLDLQANKLDAINARLDNRNWQGLTDRTPAPTNWAANARAAGFVPALVSRARAVVRPVIRPWNGQTARSQTSIARHRL